MRHPVIAASRASGPGDALVLAGCCVDVVRLHGVRRVAGPTPRLVRVPASGSGHRSGVRFRTGAVEAALGVPAGEAGPSTTAGAVPARLWT